MYQTQVNLTNSSLDCTESRTVLTINNNKTYMQSQQKQQQLSACNQTDDVYNNTCSGRLSSPAVSCVSVHHTHSRNDNFAFGNSNNSKFTCPLSTAKTTASTASAINYNAVTTSVTMQSTKRSVKTRRPILMKSYALLPIICIAIFAQFSSVASRSVLGKRLLLNTAERRVQHFKHLMRNERELQTRYAAPLHHRTSHHHMNTRSLNMNCMDFQKILISLIDQAEVSLKTLKDDVGKYTESRFNTTPENATESWSLHTLHLAHPYYNSLDRNFTNIKVNHNFDHLEGKNLDEELLKAELNKIYQTIRMLQTAFSRLSSENYKKKIDLQHKYPRFNEIINFINRSRIELNNNLETTESAFRKLNLTIEKFDENSVTFNETSPVKDWLMIKENISFLEYLNGLYAKIMNMCKAAQ